MLRALSTAASGMKAQQLNIDTIANNLANVNTGGFKKTHAEFQDLLYETAAPTGGGRASGQANPTRVEVGHGVRLAATSRDWKQGSIMSTGNALDWMIEGDGFFQVRLPDGTIGYTRDGSFKMDADRNIVTAAGYRLEPPVQVPEDVTEIAVARDGTISVMLQGDTSSVTDLAQLELAKFPNPAGMSARGGNIFQESPASGSPILAIPGEEGLGEVSSGFLEMSNVETVEELVGMIAAQRAYELNSKTISTVDEMLRTVGTLKR